jgi:hypothetical protein
LTEAFSLPARYAPEKCFADQVLREDLIEIGIKPVTPHVLRSAPVFADVVIISAILRINPALTDAIEVTVVSESLFIVRGRAPVKRPFHSQNPLNKIEIFSRN